MALQRLKILPESGLGTFDVRSCDRAYAALTGDLTLNIVGIDNGEMANLWVTQDSTGNRTVTILPYGGGPNVTVGSGTFNAAVNSTTRLSIININNRLFIEYAGGGGTASSVAFSDVTGKPTTLSGYGISDAIPLSQKGAAGGVAVLDGNAHVPVGSMGFGPASNKYLQGDGNWVAIPFANIASTPTTLAGYGITDAIPTSQKGAANGVATLGANTLLPAAQLGTGTANSTTTLHGDNTWS